MQRLGCAKGASRLPPLGGARGRAFDPIDTRANRVLQTRSYTPLEAFPFEHLESHSSRIHRRVGTLGEFPVTSRPESRSLGRDDGRTEQPSRRGERHSTVRPGRNAPRRPRRLRGRPRRQKGIRLRQSRGRRGHAPAPARRRPAAPHARESGRADRQSAFGKLNFRHDRPRRLRPGAEACGPALERDPRREEGPPRKNHRRGEGQERGRGRGAGRGRGSAAAGRQVSRSRRPLEEPFAGRLGTRGEDCRSEGASRRSERGRRSESPGRRCRRSEAGGTGGGEAYTHGGGRGSGGRTKHPSRRRTKDRSRRMRPGTRSSSVCANASAKR